MLNMQFIRKKLIPTFILNKIQMPNKIKSRLNIILFHTEIFSSKITQQSTISKSSICISHYDYQIPKSSKINKKVKLFKL